jgi:hypothetical protein
MAEKPTIGVAMIARNAEQLMPLALDPINGHVDEIAIVLGGVSDDGTAQLAEKYATLPVEDYAGDVDDRGRLLSFAQARNQSFDVLRRAGIKYAFVVDTDDQWEGIENLRKVVDQMENGGFPMVLFSYQYSDGTFVQPRIYRLDSGHWEGPCHNYWEIDGEQRIGLQTDLMTVRQDRPEEHGRDRREQNVTISETWMAEHGDNCRLLLHMAKDLMVDRKVDESLDALDRYFVQYELDGRQDPEELYNAYHAQAGVLVIKERHDEALLSALMALTVRPHAQSWALAAEAAIWLAKFSSEARPMLKLSEFCADMATYTGKARQNLHWHSDRMHGLLPLFTKARALVGLGEYRDALGTTDLALLIDPTNEDVLALRRDLARRLGTME